MDALELSGPCDFDWLTHTRNWALWLESQALTCAQIRIAAHDAQIALGCRKHTIYRPVQFMTKVLVNARGKQ